MTKALPWNITGVGFDAREAAREAARRQGKSLGQWLHGVIAEHAAEIGVEEREVVSRERIQAVTARLERMSEAAAGDRPAAGVRSSAGARRESAAETPRGPLSVVGDEQIDASRRPPRSAATFTETEFLLEEAIEVMERRARQTERRTDDALASFTELLERNEQRREQERASVATLTQKLSDIEAKLSDRQESPIKGALARLEARLEQIGRRSEMEARARLQASSTGTGNVPGIAEVDRLEEKLDAVPRAVAKTPVARGSLTSSIALATAQGQTGPQQPELPLRRRRLGEAIADIAERQRLLEDPDAAPARKNGVQAAGRDEPAPPPGATLLLEGIRSEVDVLGSKFDEMRRELTATRRSSMASELPLDFDALRREIASMAGQLRELAPRGAVTALQGQVAGLASRLDAGQAGYPSDVIDALKTEIGAIGRRIEDIGRTGAHAETTSRLQTQLEDIYDLVARRPAPAARAEVEALEGIIRDLVRRIEAVQAPGAGTPAIDALQRQVGVLATRLDSAETGFASVASIERSMHDLFAHIEDTRSLAETAAARAAHEAVRAVHAERGFDRPAPRADTAVLKAMQEDADLRTRATLDAVHATLAKVVDRLDFIETDLAGRPGAGATSEGARRPDDRSAPSPVRSRADEPPLGAADPLRDAILGARLPERARRPAAPSAKARGADGDRDGTVKADFIAAARRAAHVAQTDPSVVAMKRPATDDGEALARAGLLAKSRDYVASHKRPVLLGLAAVLIIAGTTALIQRFELTPWAPEVADLLAPAPQIASIEPSRGARSSQKTNDQLGAMTPTALPRSVPAIAARIPGSDAVVTGSIPSLPAFAARAASPVPPMPSLPTGLVAMATAGDGAAQYTLATAYATGRGVPRDFERAAKLYAQAADKGVVPAEYRLGALYERGLGVAQDKSRARTLYRQAAEAGNPRAMHNLAVLLADGDGKPDYEGAATWFRKAAQYGVHDSEFNLAILLARGLGVDQSLVQSYQWFEIAAAQGDTDAARKRDEVASRLSASELSVAKALAAAFRPRAADPAATDVTPPPGGWDGAAAPTPLNSARSKISSL